MESHIFFLQCYLDMRCCDPQRWGSEEIVSWGTQHFMSKHLLVCPCQHSRRRPSNSKKRPEVEAKVLCRSSRVSSSLVHCVSLK